MQEELERTQTYYRKEVYCERQQALGSQKKQRTLTSVDEQSPQIAIYNRYFYLREAHRDLLQKQYEEEIKKQSNTPKVKPSSYLILTEKLQKQINSAISQVTKVHSQQHSNSINYEEMSKVIVKLNPFLTKAKNQLKMEQLLSQMWIYLNSYDIQQEWLLVDRFFVLIRLLMDPNCIRSKEMVCILSEMDGFKESEALMKKFIEDYPELQEEALSNLEIFRLWQNLRQQFNRFEKHDQRSRSKSSSAFSSHQHSFRPEINQKSRVYAQKSLNKYLSCNKLEHQKEIIHPQGLSQVSSNNHEDDELNQYLSKKSRKTEVKDSIVIKDDTYGQKQSQNHEHKTYHINKQNQIDEPISYHEILYKRKLQKSKLNPRLYFEKEPEEDSLNDSSLKKKASPEEVKQIIGNLYYVPQKCEDKDFDKLKEDEELKLCTFKPQTNEQYSSTQCNRLSIPVKSYEKEVERLKKGRQQRQKAKKAYENLGKVTSRKWSKKVSTPSFIERDTPKLILEVNIGDGHIEKIKLKGDQDSALVAKKFVTKHGLDAGMQIVLQQLVEENLRKL